MNRDVVIQELRARADPRNVEGMVRFGINPMNTLGISVVELRRLAKRTGTDHGLALELWETGFHEARILASMIDDPAEVTEAQMESWVKVFDSWDVCDQVCMNLFSKSRTAYEKAREWSSREPEFEKRAGFTLIAVLAWHDKKMQDKRFEEFLILITRQALDERNYVKKAVNWALRQIGKRNAALNKKAVKVARDIQKLGSPGARWIAADALRELTRGKIF
jgi:3-methyladenine DNA glycosylase AlkD